MLREKGNDCEAQRLSRNLIVENGLAEDLPVAGVLDRLVDAPLHLLQRRRTSEQTLRLQSEIRVWNNDRSRNSQTLRQQTPP